MEAPRKKAKRMPHFMLEEPETEEVKGKVKMLNVSTATKKEIRKPTAGQKGEEKKVKDQGQRNHGKKWRCQGREQVN